MYLVFKRFMDVFLSVLLLIILFPLLFIIGILVKLTSKGPVFFKQKRAGRDDTFFEMYKFRSMRADAPRDTPTHLLKNPYDMITPVGRFIRKTSLDELPQMLNILKGDMSFIGPRPALWNQEDLIAERRKTGASHVRPGLTGWAQVNGNKNLNIEQKAKFDGEYAERMGLLFELKIVLRTFYCLLSGYGMQEGASDKNASA